MSSTYFCTPLVTIANIPEVDGYCLRPGIAWTVLAGGINADDSVIEGGRYLDALGEIHATTGFVRQDTYKTGTSGRTGRAFNVVSGTWYDSGRHVTYDTYGLSQLDGSPTAGTAAEVVSSGTTQGIEHCEMVLFFGEPPIPTVAAAVHSKDARYFYLHLAYQSPDGSDYRLAGEYGQPIALDRTRDGGQTWQRVKQLRSLGNLERYLKQNAFVVRIVIKPDYDRGRLTIEIGDGHFLRDLPMDVDAASALPRTGKIRLVCKNGVTQFWYFPARHGDLGIKPAPRDFGGRITADQAQSATLLINGLLPDGATAPAVDSQVVSDGTKVAWEATLSHTDAGDGLGSAKPPQFLDGTLLIPAVWVNSLDGIFPPLPNFGFLNTKQVEELEISDEATRTYYHSAVVTCSNTDRQYSGSYGNIAVNIQASNGGPFFQRMRGIGGGGEGVRFDSDPLMTMRLPVSDKSQVMQVPLNDECFFGGWPWPAIVRFLAAEKGNIHPKYLNYIPPCPYGPADANSRFFRVPKGAGNDPKWNFLPHMTPWGILQMLASELTEPDPNTGLPAPFWTGFDDFGNLRFEPISFWGLEPQMLYSTNDPSGVGSIIGNLQVFNSVAQMRTSLDFQGLDARTNELLHYHLNMPIWVAQAVGYNFGWMERSPRYASEDYLKYIADSASIQASLPVQTVRFLAPFQPQMHAGMTCYVADAAILKTIGRFKIDSMRSLYGLADVGGRPEMTGVSLIEARRVENTI